MSNSPLTSRDHYDLMEMFEREFRGHRMDREDKTLWSRGAVYQSGETNALFLAFRRGVSYGCATAQEPRDGK